MLKILTSSSRRMWSRSSVFNLAVVLSQLVSTSVVLKIRKLIRNPPKGWNREWRFGATRRQQQKFEKNVNFKICRHFPLILDTFFAENKNIPPIGIEPARKMHGGFEVRRLNHWAATELNNIQCQSCMYPCIYFWLFWSILTKLSFRFCQNLLPISKIGHGRSFSTQNIIPITYLQFNFAYQKLRKHTDGRKKTPFALLWIVDLPFELIYVHFALRARICMYICIYGVIFVSREFGLASLGARHSQKWF